ncbi:MAG: TonB-dependent receptor plug domain-containing protein [Gammaproteobacteria bacterium]
MSVRHSQAPYAMFGVIAAAFSTSTLAQDEEQQGAALEEVVVTGSYLYTGVDSPSPVEVLSGEDMVAFAPPDLASFFFENVPQNYSADLGQQTQNRGQRRARSIRNAAINLRGLGDENSLVVLNGRRTIPYPVADGTGWYRTDINSIVPRIAVQRTELLLDGGSAIFGSDPVAGVANFVTRNNFRGFDVNLDTRINEDASDAKNVTFAALWGAGDDNTNIIAAVEFHQEDLIELIEVDPTFSNIPDVTPNGVGLETQPNLEYRPSMGMTRWIDPDCANPAFGSPIQAHYLANDTDQEDTLEVADYGDATTCARPANFDNAGTLLNNNVQQIIAFIRAEHSFSDALRVNAEFNYSRQRFDDIDSWGDNGSNNWAPQQFTYGTDFSIPAAHPGLVRARTLQPGFGTAMGMATDVWAIGETLPFQANLPAYNHNDLFRAAFAVEGDINADWSWMVDTSAAYSEVSNAARDQIIDRYPLAINGYGGANCGVSDVNNPGAALPGVGDCSYYNPFMSSALPDAATLGLANDPSMVEWLTPLRVDNFLGEFFHVDARITGQFGELPGGPIGVAVGVAYREEYVERDSDTLVNAGEYASLGVFNDFSGKQQVDSYYVEFALPVHEDVNIQFAARQEEYKGGFDELSPKIAALWTPTDRLTVRGSFGSSFKGPSNSHTAASTIFAGMGPARLTVDGTAYGRPGGGPTFQYETTPNPSILPQTSDNLSFGADYVVTDRISVGGNIVSIEFKDLITAQTANNVLSNCAHRDANGIPTTIGMSAMTSLVYPLNPDGTCVTGVVESQAAAPGEFVTIDGLLHTTTDNIGTLSNKPTNIGFLDAQFFDLHANMNFDTPIGAINFTPNVTFTLKYDFPVGGAGGRNDLCPPPEGICSSIGRNLGMGFNGVTNMPHWQGTFPVTLNYNNHRFRAIPRYRDSLNSATGDLSEAQRAVFVHEEGLWTLDLNYNYQFNQGSSLAFSIYNAFATDPPEQSGARFNRRRREVGIQFRHSFDN